jgi:uncharacterized RDD family membrane protein YckC
VTPTLERRGRQSTLEIETPEGVVFSYALATPLTRSLAWAVDAAAIGAMTYFIGRFTQSFGHVSTDWAGALTAILYFVAQTGYGMFLEWRWRGQTLGKRIFRLRVIDAQGLRLQLSQVVIRNLLRLVDSLPLLYLVGGTACFFNRKYQRLGDLAANTVVAREPVWEDPDIEELAPAKYNSLAAYPNLAARLRSRVDPEAVGLALTALGQRAGYEDAARLKVFHDLAGYFRGVVEFPEAALEGLTDEQYVRSVLRVVFASR